MKGLLFTELMEMVEDDFGYNTANAIVLRSNLLSKGVYTTARSYHRREMSVLFEQLQQHTRLPFEQLASAFGRRLCQRMLASYPQHKAYMQRIFLLISKRSTTPVFDFLKADADSLTILYNPQAKTACLTEGMVKGYLEHLLEQSRIEEYVLHNGCRKFVVTLN